jgi:predicted methyltransferase
MGERPPRLTCVAHEAVAAALRPGGRAIDATAGNGHDTLLLARSVAPGGRVIAFDVQAAALEQTARRLRQAGLEGAVGLLQTGHERLAEAIPADWPGTVDAVMFNLGYLPGGDRGLVTRATTTVPALDAAAAVLSPGGLMSVMLYRHHDGAADEVAALQAWVARMPPNWQVEQHISPGPMLYLLRRRG